VYPTAASIREPQGTRWKQTYHFVKLNPKVKAQRLELILGCNKGEGVRGGWVARCEGVSCEPFHSTKQKRTKAGLNGTHGATNLLYRLPRRLNSSSASTDIVGMMGNLIPIYPENGENKQSEGACWGGGRCGCKGVGGHL
jgi:hypothetical protein